MSGFDRSKSPLPWTLAYFVFKERFTEVNTCYWTSIPLLTVLGREAKKHPDSSLTTDAFQLRGETFRYNVRLDVYEQQVKLHAHWTRLNTAVALSAALEGYLLRVTRAAMLSDPIEISGWPKTLDGSVLLKKGRQLEPPTDRFTHGNWTSRLNAYKATFDHVPSTLRDAHSELEKLRKTRNAVAHSLGRDQENDDDPATLLEKSKMAPLSIDLLTKWFKIVNEVVAAVDQHLSSDFIGAYELIELYHYWIRNPRATAAKLGVQLKDYDLIPPEFGTLIGTRFNPPTPIRRTYTRELGRYYSAL